MGVPIEDIVLCALFLFVCFYGIHLLGGHVSCLVGTIPCAVDLANGTFVPPERSHVGNKLPSHPFSV